MSAHGPIQYAWTDDGTMRPLARFTREADKRFVIGETYTLVEQEERSRVSHAHFFARLHDLWLALPDSVALQFPNAETLRKHALIMTGWRKERKLALSSAEEARKVAAFMTGHGDDYTLVSVAGNVVIEWTARSQSTRADGMRKAEFQRSKDDVLGWIEGLIAEAYTNSPAQLAPSIAPDAPRQQQKIAESAA